MSKPCTAPFVSAEVVTAERRLVGYAATLTADACFVPTDHPANVGDRMRVRLALGNALEPIEVDAHVVSRRLARGPGEPGGLLLALVLMHRDEERIAKLLAGTPPEGVPIGAGAEAHVLVVDDSSLMRDILAHALRRQFRQRGRAVHIDAFATTEDAAPRLEEVGYDLVIVDYYLPGAGGADLIAPCAAARGTARRA